MDNQPLKNILEKFLEEYLTKAKELGQDETMAYNYTLPELLAQSGRGEYETGDSCLLFGMSRFDTNVAKAYFNRRAQGFIEEIEERITRHTYEDQEDYYVVNVEKTLRVKKGWGVYSKLGEDGKPSVGTYEKEEPQQVITFDISNSRSGFGGHVKMYKDLCMFFPDPDDDNVYYEKMYTTRVDFFVRGERVMSLNRGMYTPEAEVRAEFTHFKHTADINSFFLVLACT